ncbi:MULTISPECIES: YueH family protein [Staphylococcus]|uniref:Uncharacterized protein n=1 Tax=Staphylococcus condimenti TaxID=70255 RepID=A0AB37H2E5_9STAP|nr:MULTISPECIES: YueH family protein [Staphylococcus]AMY05296.1 hypothetical protein A4G25_04825 [Staphylococcus condimenti]APR61503.1 hypothetical protein BTZ13_09865 [Staphylococcus condimenti]MDK8645305.1 YueH family protein [Staphylococcus condimenti]OFO98758.1 hypothetical protein HMPREF3007_01820 [Staphylococcus sp. HMSC065E08]QQS82897.1 hypothetical protein I6J05_00830 [Staphylococcus condimenti]
MDLLKIRTLQHLEGATAYINEVTAKNCILVAIPDINWSAELDIKESAEDVEENLIMYLFNLMDEDKAESLAHELTLMIFEKEIDDEY